MGISWRGGSAAFARRTRSTRLSQWAPLFALPGVSFVNLQYGDCRAELDEAQRELGVTIHDWPDADPLKDLEGLAAEMRALDLVVSIDNATVHLAGALGVPTWVLLPAVAEWRWLLGRDDSPWYSSIRLWRQEYLGAWEPVFTRVAEQLAQRLCNG